MTSTLRQSGMTVLVITSQMVQSFRHPRSLKARMESLVYNVIISWLHLLAVSSPQMDGEDLLSAHSTPVMLVQQ